MGSTRPDTDHERVLSPLRHVGHVIYDFRCSTASLARGKSHKQKQTPQGAPVQGPHIEGTCSLLKGTDKLSVR